MSVVYGSSIFAPYVCAVYTCRCGRRELRHGLHAGSAPDGWKEHAGHPICKKCAEYVAAKRAPRPRPTGELELT
jgi:hypothetical protein